MLRWRGWYNGEILYVCVVLCSCYSVIPTKRQHANDQRAQSPNKQALGATRVAHRIRSFLTQTGHTCVVPPVAAWTKTVCACVLLVHHGCFVGIWRLRPSCCFFFFCITCSSQCKRLRMAARLRSGSCVTRHTPALFVIEGCAVVACRVWNVLSG